MSKICNPILTAVCFLIFLLNSPLLFGTELTITHFSSSGHPGWGAFKHQLLDPGNFGPQGAEQGFSFNIEDVTEISAADFTNTDIFIAGFSADGDMTIGYLEAQLLKEFVTQGGSLIVVSDTGFSSLNSTNIIGSHFGSLLSVSGKSEASINVVNRKVAPGITNGPFGDVNTLSWSTNNTGKIISAGDSTLIDDYGMLSVITPAGTSGAVVLYADADLFYSGGLSPGSLGDWDKLRLNVVSYSAQSSRANSSNNPIPEPGTIVLFGAGLLWFSGVARKK